MDITAEKYYDNNLENYNLLNNIDPMTAKQAIKMMEEYHQEKLKLLGIGVVVGQCEKLPDNDISKLKVGQYVKCVKDVKPAKYFTVGKKYTVIGKRVNEPYRQDALQIRHDNGNTYWITFKNTYKRWGC